MTNPQIWSIGDTFDGHTLTSSGWEPEAVAGHHTQSARVFRIVAYVMAAVGLSITAMTTIVGMPFLATPGCALFGGLAITMGAIGTAKARNVGASASWVAVWLGIGTIVLPIILGTLFLAVSVQR